MPPVHLTPDLTLLREEFVLVQAWKKADAYIRQHNWYADVLELDLTTANLRKRLTDIQKEIEQGQTLKSNAVDLIMAPKACKQGNEWTIDKDNWRCVKHPPTGIGLRPLAHLTLRDQIISTAVLMLLANIVETKQKDPSLPLKEARHKRMVSYGHRLDCAVDGDQLRFRWGNSHVYRQYFDDYRSFLARPQSTVDDVFGKDRAWAIVHCDLSQFYDRVRPSAMIEKIQNLLPKDGNLGFIDFIRSFLNWTWHTDDKAAALEYAGASDPSIDGFDELALPQGGVASGFLANLFLGDFDDAVAQQIDRVDSGRWFDLVDYCRYVDDMRFVIRLKPSVTRGGSQDIVKEVGEFIRPILAQHAPGMELSAEKSAVVLGRDAGAGTIRVSTTMQRIQTNTSGVIDLILGWETIDVIESLLSTRVEAPLELPKQFEDTFVAAVSDVRDESVARFAANRFRQTYRSLRPLSAEPTPDDASSPWSVNSRATLDNKAAHFSGRLIERWVRDPSNMRLLRVGMDIFPKKISIEFVLHLLKQHLPGTNPANSSTTAKVYRDVVCYCLAELLRAAATETGVVDDHEKLPSGVTLDDYRAPLKQMALEVCRTHEIFPWYVVQQAMLFLAIVGEFVVVTGSVRANGMYVNLHRLLNKDIGAIAKEDVVPLTILQSRFQDCDRASQTFYQLFSQLANGAAQSECLEQLLQENTTLGMRIVPQMNEAERAAYGHIFRGYGLELGDRFPDNPAKLKGNSKKYPLLSIARSDCNPFTQEYALLHFILKILDCTDFDVQRDSLCPSQVELAARNWYSLTADSFPISDDELRVEIVSGAVHCPDRRFQIPKWIELSDRWKYQLGQIMRVLLTGQPDFTSSREHPENNSGNVPQYHPLRSSWFRRSYGLYTAREAFGPDWLPISPWMISLMARLLEWPGALREEDLTRLPNAFDQQKLRQCVSDRISVLNRLYGKASKTPVLPVDVPMRPRVGTAGGDAEQPRQGKVRVCVAQTALPKLEWFLQTTELNEELRRQQRQHLAAVLVGVHRMLEIRKTLAEEPRAIDLLVLPELTVHTDDLRTHLLPFARQHQCMIFAGLLYHQPELIGKTVNSGIWLIPFRSITGKTHIAFFQQGKKHPTQLEIQLGVSPFRPVQWLFEYGTDTHKGKAWKLSGSICYDATDLSLAADLRNQSNMYLVSALNKDVGTFDNMAAALHYHMFQHVVVANSGEFGGSTGKAPFADPHARNVFHTHGNNQVSINFFEMDPDSQKSWKTPPAGFAHQ